MLFTVDAPAADLYLNDAKELSACFELVDYRLDDPSVPPLYNAYMPDGMGELGDGERIRLFIRVLLPLILRENGRIEQEARRLESVAAQGSPAVDEERFFRATAVKYRSIERKEENGELDADRRAAIVADLRLKIRPVDPAIALGIAALESGWGTSRFVEEGNNLFGHTAVHAWKGIQPLKWSGAGRNIKRFETIGDSLTRFMLNLNRNRAYQRYRFYRELLPAVPLVQADGFSNYSRIGADYTVRLKLLMKRFGLLRFSAYRLAGEERALAIDRIAAPYLP